MCFLISGGLALPSQQKFFHMLVKKMKTFSRFKSDHPKVLLKGLKVHHIHKTM